MENNLMDFTAKWLEKIGYEETGQVEVYNVWTENGLLKEIISDMVKLIGGIHYESIAAIATNGVVFGAALADRLGKGLILFRKINTMRGGFEKVKVEFTNWKREPDGLEIELDTIKKGKTYLVVDDLVQTGSTLFAVNDLLKRTGSKVSAYLVMANVSGFDTINNVPLYSLIRVKKSKIHE